MLVLPAGPMIDLSIKGVAVSHWPTDWSRPIPVRHRRGLYADEVPSIHTPHTSPLGLKKKYEWALNHEDPTKLHCAVGV